jgi:hypothetical protein
MYPLSLYSPGFSTGPISKGFDALMGHAGQHVVHENSDAEGISAPGTGGSEMSGNIHAAMTATDRLIAVYQVRADAESIEARALAIAVEQSVEMPVAAIDDPGVLRDIVGRIESIADRGDGSYTVRIGLAASTTGAEAGQFMNMVFGNTSIHDDVTLEDVVLAPGMGGTVRRPTHRPGRSAGSCWRRWTRHDLFGDQTPGPASGKTRRHRREIRAGRHRLYQG